MEDISQLKNNLVTTLESIKQILERNERTIAEKLAAAEKEIKQKRALILKEREQWEKDKEKKEKNLQKDIEQQFASLRKEQELFSEEKRKMEGIQTFQKSMIKLNVGGHKFATSKTTLSNPLEPNSMLNAMFSGRYILESDEDGHFFIDRDGRHFFHILNYLRDATKFVIPGDEQVRRELLIEAEYFRLENLVAQMDTQKFVYQSDFDQNGLFYWLGTKGKSREWTSPESVSVSWSNGSKEKIILSPSAHHSAICGITHIIIKLNTVFALSAFSLRVRSCNNCGDPVQFPKLEGQDGGQWEALWEGQNNFLNMNMYHLGHYGNQGQPQSLTVNINAKKAYQSFKISCRGGCLGYISNIEFYGEGRKFLM